MTTRFSFERRTSPLFGAIRRPVANVSFRAQSGRWLDVTMLVDTGADFTLLPRWCAEALEIDLDRDCEQVLMSGIGGRENVYLFRRVIAKLGSVPREIPVGFTMTDSTLPLMGRQFFLETFRVVFENFETSFDEPPKRRKRAR